MTVVNLMRNSSQVSIYQKHLWALATEICKSLADINPGFIKPYFIIKEMSYNLQNGCALKLRSANSTHYGISMFIVELATTLRKLQSVTT